MNRQQRRAEKKKQPKANGSAIPTSPTAEQEAQLIQQGKLLYDQKQFAQAIPICERLMQLNPNNPRSHTLCAIISRATGNMENAIKHLEHGIRLAPQDSIHYLVLGDIHRELAAWTKAIPLYEKVIQLQPENSDTYLALGNAYFSAGLFDKSIDILEKLLSFNDNSIPAYATLANVYERNNNIEKLEETINRMESLSPGSSKRLIATAKFYLRQKDMDKAKNILKNIIQKDTNRSTLNLAFAELGKLYQKQGDYDKAFEHFTQGQKIGKQIADIEHGHRAHEATMYNNMLTACHNWISKDIVESWKKLPRTSDYPAFIVGSPRSGTTLTEQVLASHSNIHVLSEEPCLRRTINDAGRILALETYQYPEFLADVTPEHIESLQQAYFKETRIVIPEDAQSKHLIDKNPASIAHLCFIARLFPQTQILMILRDPRDVCLSCFTQPFAFNDATRNYYSLESTVEFYAMMMDAYLHFKETLPLNILEIKYEDMVTELEPEARKMLEHLGEPWDDDVLRYYEKDKHRNINTPSYEAVTKPTYTSSIGQWKHYETQFAPYLSKLEPYLEKFGYDT